MPKLPKFPPDPQEWLPKDPLKSPLPAWLSEAPQPDAQPKKAQAKSEPSDPDIPPMQQGDYEIIVRRRGPAPTWLKEYQQKLAAASKIAKERTKHLEGKAERLVRMNQIVAELMKTDVTPEPPSG